MNTSSRRIVLSRCILLVLFVFLVLFPSTSCMLVSPRISSLEKLDGPSADDLILRANMTIEHARSVIEIGDLMWTSLGVVVAMASLFGFKTIYDLKKFKEKAATDMETIENEARKKINSLEERFREFISGGYDENLRAVRAGHEIMWAALTESTDKLAYDVQMGRPQDDVQIALQYEGMQRERNRAFLEARDVLAVASRDAIRVMNAAQQLAETGKSIASRELRRARLNWEDRPEVLLQIDSAINAIDDRVFEGPEPQPFQ